MTLTTYVTSCIYVNKLRKNAWGVVRGKGGLNVP